MYLDRKLPDDVKERKKREDDAEIIRLIYVALTRAKSHCNVMIRVTDRFGGTMLSKILFEKRRILFDLEKEMKEKLNPEKAAVLLEIICGSSGGTIGFTTERDIMSTGRSYSAQALKPEVLQRREFHGDPARRWMMFSYSSVAQSMRQASEKEDEGYAVEYRPSPGVLPPGARSGLCLHEVFENSDFTWRERGMFRDTASAALKRYGYGEEYLEGVVDMVVNVLATPLDSRGLKLESVPPEHRLSELEFHFPLASLSGLKRFIDGPGFAGTGAESGAARPISGMMKGYVDLVFLHDGRYWIIDWKSNMLELSRGGYCGESILAEMKHHNYHLQYHIYTVALHRYLGFRLGASYDYEKDFGGVFYLFIRGMNGSGSTGVFSARPDFKVIDELDRLMGGEVRP